MRDRSWLLCRGWSNCFACAIDGGFVDGDGRAASHADQQIHAMSLLKMEQAKASNSACCSYSCPIVHALSKLEKAQLRVTFDLANFIARVMSDQMLRMANHILHWLDILSYQFSRFIFNSVYIYIYISHSLTPSLSPPSLSLSLTLSLSHPLTLSPSLSLIKNSEH